MRYQEELKMQIKERNQVREMEQQVQRKRPPSNHYNSNQDYTPPKQH